MRQEKIEQIKTAISDLSLPELQETSAMVGQKIEENRQAHRKEVAEKLRQHAKDEGFDIDDLFNLKPSKRPVKKVPPKYRDPKTGKTWSGRGMKPVWFREALASGASKESLLI